MRNNDTPLPYCGPPRPIGLTREEVDRVLASVNTSTLFRPPAEASNNGIDDLHQAAERLTTTADELEKAKDTFNRI